MTEKPLIWQFAVSPYAAKVRRVLHYKGIAFDVRNLGATQLGWVKKHLSPSGKTPVMDLGGQRIVDSTDIVAALEAAFPDQPVIPADPAERALAHVLEDWSDESLYFYDLAMRSWPNNVGWLADDVLAHERSRLKPLLKKLLAKSSYKIAFQQGIGRKPKAVVCREMAAHFAAIEALLAKTGWLAGAQLSIADIAVVAMCTVLERAEEARDLMAAHPRLLDWRARTDALTLPAGIAPEARAFA